jgi:addiction module HigA family antidote
MSKRTYPHRPDWCIPPSAMIEEALMERNQTQRWLAERMGRPIEQINRLVRGHIRVTATTALQLERALKSPAQYWMNLESAWQLHLARTKAKKGKP